MIKKNKKKEINTCILFLLALPFMLNKNCITEFGFSSYYHNIKKFIIVAKNQRY